MRVAELLDVDVAVLGSKAVGSARAGFDWWLEELQGLVPSALRASGKGRGRLVAQRHGASEYILLPYNGVARLHTPGRSPIRAALRLADEAVLVRRLDALPLPSRDLRQMMVLDVERLTPFRAEEIYVDVVLPPSLQASVAARLVIIGVVPRAVAERAIAEAQAAGLAPNSLIVGEGDATLDFLPAMRGAGALGPPLRGAGVWWAAMAVLVALNVGCWIWRDSRSLSDLKATVSAQQPLVQRVENLRASLFAEAQRRHDLDAALAADEPLRALDAVSRALPDQAWVQRVTFSTTSIRLAGYHKSGVDVLAALKGEPLLANVHSVSPDETASDSGEGDNAVVPFDLSTDLPGPHAPTGAQ